MKPSALGRFRRYVMRGVRLGDYLERPGDGRVRPQIAARDLLWSLLMGQVLREGSHHAIEALVHSSARRALGVVQHFGDDALGYFTERLAPGPMRQALAAVVRGAKRNKAFESTRWIGLALDGTGAVVGLVGAGLVDHVAAHSTSAGSSSIAPLSCEDDPPGWSPGALRFETAASGPACACAVSGTERLAGAMEYGVRKPCEAGTSLSFSLLGQDALVRVVHGEACGSVSFAAVCAPGVLDVPRQTATGCVNECLALGCQWSSASGTCSCSGGSVPRGMRQAIFDLEPLLPAAFAEGERLGCAAPAP